MRQKSATERFCPVQRATTAGITPGHACRLRHMQGDAQPHREGLPGLRAPYPHSFIRGQNAPHETVAKETGSQGNGRSTTSGSPTPANRSQGTPPGTTKPRDDGQTAGPGDQRNTPPATMKPGDGGQQPSPVGRQETRPPGQERPLEDTRRNADEETRRTQEQIQHLEDTRRSSEEDRRQKEEQSQRDGEVEDQLHREEVAARNQGTQGTQGTQQTQVPRPGTQEHFKASLTQGQRESSRFQQAATLNRETTDRNQRLLEDLQRNLKSQAATPGDNPRPPLTRVAERVPPMTMPEIPGVRPALLNPLRGPPTDDQRQREKTVRRYGTFLTRELRGPGQDAPGKWWRDLLTQERIVTQIQRNKRYDKIPCQPEAPSRLFCSEDGSAIQLRNGTAVPRNEYLEKMLREYIQLLNQILDKQTQRIDSSVFRLQSAPREQAAMAKRGALDRIAECESLQDQLRALWPRPLCRVTRRR